VPRSLPPFHADHVGSLLRPQALLDARAAHAGGTLDDDGLRAVEDAAITDVVRMQESVGLQSATDGEFRRTSWHMDFIYALAGIDRAPENLTVSFHNADGDLEFTSAAMKVDGTVGLDHTIFGDAFGYLQRQVTTAVPKLTIPSPSMVHYRGGAAAVDKAVYPTMDAFWDDLVAAYQAEVAGLAELGCTYLQLDDTSLAYLNDPKQREMVAAQGGDPDHQHEQYIAQFNRAIAGRPASMRVTTHLCRGNYRSSWTASGGYDFVAEALFGGLEALRFVPPGKQVVLGLVTTKSGVLESKDDLKRRIDEAARFVPLEQLCLSGQCGFSSTVEGNALTYDQQVAKLALIVETAAEVWG
jgi:5-methyltetrahydropteroyltriglutamate--homocysteine methyltransferase